MITLFDHAIVFAFAVALPILSYYGYRRFLANVDRVGTALRLRAYRSTVLMQWALLLATLFLWSQMGRDPAALGLNAPGTLRFWGGTALALLAVLPFLYQFVLLHQSKDYCRRVVEEMGPIRPLLPHSAREARAFMPVAVTAGIAEEVLFRGFLIWYLAQWMNVFAAAAFALLFFTLAHSYQGYRGAIRVALIGLWLSAIFLLAESLYPVIFLHIVVDVAGGILAHQAFKRCAELDKAEARETAEVPEVAETGPTSAPAK